MNAILIKQSGNNFLQFLYKFSQWSNLNDFLKIKYYHKLIVLFLYQILKVKKWKIYYKYMTNNFPYKLKSLIFKFSLFFQFLH